MAPRLPPVRKSLGQHFLNDRRILARIADALELSGSELVIEIGPGRGALTELLLERARHVIAIEYDRALAALLRERYAADSRITIVEHDVLDVNFGELAKGPYVLAGNVPYYITTPILFKGLTAPRPERAVYLVQREVAERIVAAPGHREYGALSVNVQSVATAELVFRVSRGAFQPPPRVDSAVLRLTPLAHAVIVPAEEDEFRSFVQAAFGMRRKQMRRVLRELWTLDADGAERILDTVGIDPAVRPETLSPVEFANLLRARKSLGQR
ncbi:MAG TPA: 16S rRNA (adenine(1518)-N(6)/adenine(1519)-N(6))-dimethyltransferase RsmA [Gemmatimonadaceae bacterium]|nr:16S rRNA (adenine(1518)-N(6)/adenine(1519)-N(6))-dimethyltransferase RsmA [Gemmatimonadaceae bacterium]